MEQTFIQMKDISTVSKMEKATNQEALAGVVAIPKHKDIMEDVIKLGEFPCDHGFELAATKCSVPWSEESSKLLVSQMRNIHVQTECIDSSSVFFVVGSCGYYRSGQGLHHSLCLGDLIITGEEIEFSMGSVKLKNGSIYKRTSNPCCKWCRSKVYGWDAIVKKTNFQLTLDQKAIDTIKTACLHWHEYFYINKYNVLKLKNKPYCKSWEFKRYNSRYALFVRNWSRDSLAGLEKVSTLWTHLRHCGLSLEHCLKA